MKFIYVDDVTLPEHLAGQRGTVIESDGESIGDLLRSGHVIPGDSMPEAKEIQPPTMIRTVPKDLGEVDPFLLAASGEIYIERKEDNQDE